jgi:hypothetical protein
MAKIKVRKGMPSVAITKAEFTRRARERFVDPAFEPMQAEIDKIIEAAWSGYHDYRKAPRTRRAGPRSPPRTRPASARWSFRTRSRGSPTSTALPCTNWLK